MERGKTDLSSFNNDWFDIGASKIKWAFWFLANALILKNPMLPFSGLRVQILKLFGAKIGQGVVIKPGVHVKFPWKLEIGNHVWIGENVWIENHAHTYIGNHVCVSQGALLLCGNHNYKKPTFDLMVGKITLEEGVWIGAMAMVCPGVVCHSHAILTASSVTASDLEPYSIYKGNPAVKIRERKL